MRQLVCTWFLLAAISLSSVPAIAAEGESIVFNPATGNYLVTYQNSDGGSFHQIVFIPRP